MIINHLGERIDHEFYLVWYENEEKFGSQLYYDPLEAKREADRNGGEVVEFYSHCFTGPSSFDDTFYAWKWEAEEDDQ